MDRLRKLANRFRGRKLCLDEDLSLSEVQRLVLDAGSSVLINMKINDYKISHSMSGENQQLTPQKAAVLLKSFFKDFMDEELNLEYLISAFHQVYSGRREQRHYIDIKIGKPNLEKGGYIPILDADIDFVSKNKSEKEVR
jgi:hypothetical protein